MSNRRDERFVVYSSEGLVLHHLEMRPMSLSASLCRFGVRPMTDGYYLVIQTAVVDCGDGSCLPELELKIIKLDPTSGNWKVKMTTTASTTTAATKITRPITPIATAVITKTPITVILETTYFILFAICSTKMPNISNCTRLTFRMKYFCTGRHCPASDERTRRIHPSGPQRMCRYRQRMQRRGAEPKAPASSPHRPAALYVRRERHRRDGQINGQPVLPPPADPTVPRGDRKTADLGKAMGLPNTNLVSRLFFLQQCDVVL